MSCPSAIRCSSPGLPLPITLTVHLWGPTVSTRETVDRDHSAPASSSCHLPTHRPIFLSPEKGLRTTRRGVFLGANDIVFATSCISAEAYSALLQHVPVFSHRGHRSMPYVASEHARIIASLTSDLLGYFSA